MVRIFELCSTPFGITARGTHAPVVLLRCLSVVLNAFRHHSEGDTTRELTSRNIPATCSTPFGITARGTHLSILLPPTINPMCSTPFGITARGTKTP